MSELNKFNIDDVSKEELLRMVDKGYAAMMAVIGIGNLSMDMTLSDIPEVLKDRFLPSRIPQSEWVRCDERMPEPDVSVICWANDIVYGWVEVLYRLDGQWRNSSDSECFHALVSHWMPLPEPPKQ